MLKLTSRRLRRYWYLLVGIIVLLSLTPNPRAHNDLRQVFFDRFWFHFLAYVVVSILPLLAWRRRAGLILSSGTALLSIGLEMLRGFVNRSSVDVQGTIVNLLGIVAGILLGLNILMLRSRARRAERSALEGSQPDVF